MLTELATALLLLIPNGQPVDPSAELKKVEGKWKVAGYEEVGTVLSPKEIEKEKEVFTFKGNTLVISRGGDLEEKFTATLKPGKEFGQIDLKHTDGKYEGKTCHAIYVLDGDDLKICTASKLRADEPADRPNVFSTKKSDNASVKPGKLLFVLKRVKE